MASFIDPTSILTLLVMILSGGVRDLASCLSTDAYWNSKSVVVSFAELSHELDPVKPADIARLIADLDAIDPKARELATQKIAAVGTAALPALEDAVNNAAPEVAARARGLRGRIRAASKVASIRRLMAIRTLGEMKDPRSVPVLTPLLESKEMFEAEYARAAIARIEGKPCAPVSATAAERAADVSLFPARLDALAQVAPVNSGSFTIDKMIAQLPMDETQKSSARNEATSQILRILETVGNVRLDALTWGFYAAPPGKPGNTVFVARAEFDTLALCEQLARHIPKTRKLDGVDVFQIDDDSAILVSPDHHVVYVAREPTGDLELEKMAAALKNGAGDFATNADLPKLVKSIDATAPLWAVAALSPGLKEIVGPLGEFETATLTATQTMEKGIPVTQLRLEAATSDAARARQTAENVRLMLKNVATTGRKQQAKFPFIKPLLDLAESAKIESEDGKATTTGELREMPMIPMGMIVMWK